MENETKNDHAFVEESEKQTYDGFSINTGEEGDKDTSAITFFISNEPILEMSKDGFFVRGEKVEDKDKVYEGFKNWLKAAQSAQKKNGTEQSDI